MKFLFLCTGNYYRSRFAEEYFNHFMTSLNKPHTADSLGIMREFEGNGNVGPISKDTLAKLKALDIAPQGHERMPAYVYPDHFDRYDRVIAVSKSEHQPMLEEIWPGNNFALEFFDVEDLHIEGPETALPRLIKHLDKLIASIP